LWVWLQELANIRTVLFLCLFTCHHFWRILGLQGNKLYINPQCVHIYFILKHFNNSNTQTYKTFFNICTCPAAHLVISMTFLSFLQWVVCRQMTVSLLQPLLSTYKWWSVLPQVAIYICNHVIFQTILNLNACLYLLTKHKLQEPHDSCFRVQRQHSKNLLKYKTKLCEKVIKLHPNEVTNQQMRLNTQMQGKTWQNEDPKRYALKAMIPSTGLTRKLQ